MPSHTRYILAGLLTLSLVAHARIINKREQKQILQCDKGKLESCDAMATRYRELGADKEADDLFMRNCAEGFAKSCNHMGVHAEAGRELKTAKQWYRRACGLKYPISCMNLGHLEQGDGDLVAAEAHYRFACSKRLVEACAWLQCAFDPTKNQSSCADTLPIDIKPTEGACLNGDPRSCFLAGLYHWHKDSKDLAKNFYTRGCERGEVLSCYNWGYVEIANEKPLAALSPFFKACNRGFAQGCLSLANVYEGEGDYDQATKFYDEACTRGSEPACKRAERLAFARPLQGLINLLQTKPPVYLSLAMVIFMCSASIALIFHQRHIIQHQHESRKKQSDA